VKADRLDAARSTYVCAHDTPRRQKLIGSAQAIPYVELSSLTDHRASKVRPRESSRFQCSEPDAVIKRRKRDPSVGR